MGPETLARYALNLDYGFSRFQKKALNFVESKGNTERWIYDSKNHVLPQKLVNDLWTKNYLGNNVYRQGRDENESSAGRLLFDLLGRSIRYKKSYVMIDRLLEYDPQRDLHKMTFFVRFSVNRPNYPQPQTQQAGEMLTELLGKPAAHAPH